MAACQISTNSTEKFARKCAKMFLLSLTTVTFNEDQGHPNWYQTLELSSICHHIKLERNRFANVRCKPTLKLEPLPAVLIRGDKNEYQIYQNKSLDQFHPNPLKTCEVNGAEGFAFYHHCGLESRSRSATLV